MTVRSATMNRNQPFWPALSARLRAAVTPLPAFGRDFGIVVAVLGVYFILRGQAPGRDAFAVAFTVRLIDTDDAALDARFAGSPAFVAGGVDLFETGPTGGAMACRVYPTPDGPRNVPALQDLRKALKKQAARAART